MIFHRVTNLSSSARLFGMTKCKPWSVPSPPVGLRSSFTFLTLCHPTRCTNVADRVVFSYNSRVLHKIFSVHQTFYCVINCLPVWSNLYKNPSAICTVSRITCTLIHVADVESFHSVGASSHLRNKLTVYVISSSSFLGPFLINSICVPTGHNVFHGERCLSFTLSRHFIIIFF